MHRRAVTAPDRNRRYEMDGSAATASPPSSTPSMRRVFLPPPRRKPSKSDNIYRRMGAPVRWHPCKTQSAPIGTFSYDHGSAGVPPAQEQRARCLRSQLMIYEPAFGPSTEPSRCARCRRSDWKNSFTAASITANVTPLAEGRALKTTSHPGPNSSRCFRTTSRNRRLTRLRCTEPPTARETVSPILLSALPVWSTNASRKSKFRRRPLSYTRRNSADRNKRACLGKPYRWFARFEMMCSPKSRRAFVIVLLVRDGEAMSAPRTPARKNCSPVLGAHPLAEAMRLGPLSLIWLVGSLRHAFPLSFKTIGHSTIFDNTGAP